jgi:hypothetical protein
MGAANITSLTETAIRYQKDLKMLPYAVLATELGRLGINLFPGVQNKDVITEFQRKQGIGKPYSTTVDPTNSAEIAKASERTLEVLAAYASVKDNIQNYQKVAVGPDVLLGKNQDKKHPWERVMLETIIRTFGEDILDALFGGKRDTSDQTPTGMFDGIDELIATDIAAGLIAAGQGNYKQVGSLAAPSGETDYACFTSLLDFWRQADPQLRAQKTLLMVPFDVATHMQDAVFNKFRYKPTTDDFNRVVLEGTNGNCQVVASNNMGTGDRLILTVPGNIDFGMDTLSDNEFVQVRTPYEDPNLVQMWIQGKYGMRIRSVHKKMFQISDGTPVHNILSGDYSS